MTTTIGSRGDVHRIMPPRRSVPRQASARVASGQQVRAAKSSNESSALDGDEGSSSARAGPSGAVTGLQNGASHKAWSGPEPVAIDLGAYSVRITIGHDSKTSIVTRCPNAIARMPQHRRFPQPSAARKDEAGADYTGLPANSLVGPQILTRCTDFGALSLRQPMDRGLVVDWAAQKIILDVALREALGKANRNGESKTEAYMGGRLLEGRPVVITEAYFNLPDLQSAMDLLVMEEYGASSIWRCAPAHIIPYTPNLFAGPRSGSGKRARPECICIVDLGHGASHVVPCIGESILWHAARRHVISQRLITNLLKESLSFRQWDMMDEPWLVGHIKEQCCFVAGCAGQRGEDTGNLEGLSPSQWSFAALTELCQSTSRTKNPIVQEYVLPDYSGETLKNEYGFIKRGPASRSRGSGKQSTISDNDFIIEAVNTQFAADSRDANGNSDDVEDDEDEENDDDDDFDIDAADGDSDVSDGRANHSKGQKRKSKQANGERAQASDISKRKQEDDIDSEQVLILERERFQVPEVMFNPGIIGLDDAPLHDVIRASIEACDEEVRGPMWANIVLVGGGAAMRNIKTRLYNELRPLAPDICPLHIWSPDNPSMATVHAAQAMLASPAQSAPLRKIKTHLLPVSQYSLAAARQTFGSWCAGPEVADAIQVD